MVMILPSGTNDHNEMLRSGLWPVFEKSQRLRAMVSTLSVWWEKSASFTDGFYTWPRTQDTSIFERHQGKYCSVYLIYVLHIWFCYLALVLVSRIQTSRIQTSNQNSILSKLS